jgi:tricorn protease
MHGVLIAAALLLAFANPACPAGRPAQAVTLLLREPTVSNGPIAVVYANDLRARDLDGHNVRRLTTGGGVATRLTWHPRDDRVRGWSPDGPSVLFVSPGEIGFFLTSHTFAVPAGGQLR